MQTDRSRLSVKLKAENLWVRDALELDMKQEKRSANYLLEAILVKHYTEKRKFKNALHV